MARGKDIPEMFEAFRMQRGEQKSRESGKEKSEQERPKKPEAEAEAPRPVEPVARPPRPPEPEPSMPTQAPEDGVPPGYLRRRSPVWLRAVMDSDDAHFLPLGERAQVVVSLSYNVLIVVIIVFVLFSVLIGFVGYTVGMRWPGLKAGPPVVREETSQPVRGGGMAVRGGQPAGVGVPARGGAPVATVRAKYTVKVLEVPNTPTRSQAVDMDIAFLKRQRVEPVVKQINSRMNTIAILAGAFKESERDQAEQLMKRLRMMTVDGRLEFKDAQVVPVP